MGGPGIEPTTLDLCSQSGAYDFSAMGTPAIGTAVIPLAKLVILGEGI